MEMGLLQREFRVLDVSGLQEKFGQFTYRSNANGSITITDRDWIDDNIVRCTLVRARNGRDVRTECHRLAKEPLERAHAQIAETGLWRLIDTWDGLWVPRHRVWNTRNALSSHSWGVAEDLNASENPFGGQVTAANTALAEIFVKHGFDWGGFWRREIRDGMHFELVDPDAYRNIEARTPQLILGIKRNRNTLHYVNLETDNFEPGRFTVDAEELASLLNGNAGANGLQGRVGVADAIPQLGWEIFDRGDELDDRSNPRYYLFTQRAD
jgi:hypothetical protein